MANVNPVNPLWRNTQILLLAEGSTVIAGVILVLTLARALNPAALGLFSFAFSVGGVVAILSLYGAHSMITREIARNPERFATLLGASLTSRGGMGLGFLGLSGLVLVALGYPKERLLVILLLIGARYTESMLFLFCSFFRGVQEMKYEAMTRTVLSALYVLLGVPILLATRSLLIFSISQFAAAALIAGICLHMLLRRFGMKRIPRFSFRDGAIFAREAMSFSLYGILCVLYIQINTIMLFLIKGDLATGLYVAGFRFLSAISPVALALIGAMLPALSRFRYPENSAELVATFQRAMRVLMIAGSFFSLALYLFAEPAMRIYGPSLASAAPALRIMSFALLFSFMNGAISTLLFAANQERRVTLMLFSSVVFVVLINAALLPMYGYLGAALTTLLPELFFITLQVRQLRRSFPQVHLTPMFLKLAAVCAAIIAGWRYAGLMPLALQAGLFIFLFGLGLVVFRIFRTDDIRRLTTLFARHRLDPIPQAPDLDRIMDSKPT